MKTVNLKDKVYSFFLQTEEKKVDLKEIIIYANDHATSKALPDMFVGSSKFSIANAQNGILIELRGYCILENLDYAEGLFTRGENKLMLVYKTQPVTLYKKHNPFIQWNDTEVDEDECFSFINKQIEEEEEEEIVEEQTSEEQQEQPVPVEETKFDRDVKILIGNGYELHEAEQYRLLIKPGALPILAEIIDKDHYNEYKFIEKVDDKQYVFLDFKKKKVTFTLD